MISGKNSFFAVLGYILEIALKNILWYLIQRNKKKKKKS